ncbi:acyltransferase family protein [Mucilaginibacter sp. X5P1]|uniref:acyltransferase family protein n=1 Tax=Mucilaginibacter sp. X5P1 TaxID=2723088 RepID=UPI001608932E|nr:acyltransferase [Mucilaginibacter sp. X5P1]MBB6140089.1 peptidoglycan/LPS O-acetylase OafA/YrhL [Mucilaginibacter sp. X5P1]
MQNSLGNSTKHKRFKELDALRGIAAIMVVLFHFTLGRPLHKFGFNLGVTGVDLFFIISGFVIYMTLTKVKGSLEFIINRVSRLYPTYWVCVTFTFVFICLQAHFDKSAKIVPPGFLDYVGNMTMFQNYFNINDIDGPYWTMIVEMLFYIGILLLFHFRKLKYVNIIGITLSIAVVIISSLFYNHTLVQQLLAAVPLLTFIPLFLAGTIFYNIYEYKENLIQQYTMLLLCLICQELLLRYGGRSRFYVTHVEYLTMLILYFSLFTLFVTDKLKWIINRVTLFLGKISFPLYLIHQYIAVMFIIPILTKTYNVNYWVASLLVALPIVLILAYLVNRFVEVPVSRRMREKLNSIAFEKHFEIIQ